MPTRRRDFLKKASLLAAGSVAGTQLSNQAAAIAAPAKKQMGLQTYSLRHHLNKDLKGGLARLSKLGYNELELYGFNHRHDKDMFGDPTTKDPVFIAPADYQKMADDAGIKLVSSHLYGPFDDFTKETSNKVLDWFKKAADIHAKIGIKYLLQAGMTDVKNMDQVKFMCDTYNRIGEATKAVGIQFAYHNHSGEFRTIPYYVVPARSDIHVPGRYPQVNNFEKYAIEGTDPDLVSFELDCYWTVVGVNDPLEWFSKYPNRFKMMHIKDRWIIGASGVMNFPNIFKKAYEIGIQHYFIEIEANPEEKKLTQWDAVEASAKYIQSASFVK